jgi:hypothetical protein
MTTHPDSVPPAAAGHENPSPSRSWRLALVLLAAWAGFAYLLAPLVWRIHFRHPKELDGLPRLTRTGDGHPGDPVNIGLLGTEADVIRAMTAAGWFPADPITFRTSVRIAVDSVFRRPDAQAPVSNLYLFGRKQDLAFELPVGDNPRQRHHVRFWRTPAPVKDRTLWLGAATFDERVGLSYTTAQVTHHIGPNVDAERDRIIRELKAAGWVVSVDWIDNFHRERSGRNGGGDRWTTDGRLAEVELADRPGPGLAPTP